jgi:hypothetical protein
MIRTGRPHALFLVLLLVPGFILWFNPFSNPIASISPKLSWHPDHPSDDNSHVAEGDDQPLTNDDSNDSNSYYHEDSSSTLSVHGVTPSLTAVPSASTSSPSGFARQLLASDLLARPLTNHSGAVPKIFHQSWKTLELPGKFAAWSASCRQMHADWEWVLWTDEDNLWLVQMHFPWLEEAYLDLPGEIYRADLVRNLYMHTFGG